MKRSTAILALVGLVGFFYGLAQLFNLRFQAGDIYPPYSSFRADPLGSKALYESLDALAPTSRHLTRWSKLPSGQNAALLYLGADPENLAFPKQQMQWLETFVNSGGRLVISLLTRYKKSLPPPAAPQREDSLLQPAERWGFDLKYLVLSTAGEHYQHATATRVQDDSTLPPELLWHTAIYFTNLASEWRPIYAISNDLPVLIQRPFGAGHIVICSDPYPFSNEALLADPQPALLAWIVGSARDIIFDETHLGVREEPGLATLLRRYRLHGMAAALLFLCLLLIWKNSDRFIPLRPDATAGGSAIRGKSSAFGFVNLLRRNLAPGELIIECINQWKRSEGRRVSRARLTRIQSVIDAENSRPPRQRDPVRIYRAISEILSSRKI